MKSVFGIISALCVMGCAQTVIAETCKSGAHLVLGDTEEALVAANKAVKAGPKDPEAFYCRFQVYMARAQDAEALADINCAVELSGGAKYLTARAGLHLAMQDEDAAMRDLDAAIAADKTHAAAWRLRATLKLRQAAQASKPKAARTSALEDARTAVRIEPGEACGYLVRGEAFGAANLHGRARADFVKATELSPGNTQAWYSLAQHDYFRANAYPRAVEYLDKAIALDPCFRDAYVLRARAKLARGGVTHRAAALEDLAAALRLDPDAPDAYFIRAGARHSAHDYAGALADLRTARALDPDSAAYGALWDTIHNKDSERLMDQAEKLLNEGKYDEAAARVRKALEIDPRSEAFHEALRIIETHRTGGSQ